MRPVLIRTELDSMPAELDEISRRVLQLEIEETRKQEKDKSSKDRLENLRQELGNAGTKWKPSSEGKTNARDHDVRVLREQIESMRAEMERPNRLTI